MVLKSEDFEVRDAKTGEDLTRSILLQIILEEESGGLPMFTTPMLAQMIRFYGHAMQGVMGQYMERNLQIFTELQQRFVEQGKGLVEGKPFAAQDWTQALGGSAGSLMAGYVEQSRVLLEQMQEQMKRSGTIFPVPGFPPKT
jgi:polyhydroxyalkanoate synthesis repressor PhaR